MQRETKPLLCYVTDRLALSRNAGSRASNDLLAVMRRGIAAGMDWIQLREKDLPARGLLELAREAVRAARGSATRIVVNDQLGVALAAGGAGVHLGEASLPVAEVARWCRAAIRDGRVPEGFRVGASRHSPEAAVEAERDGADYIFFGPVFATPSKAAYGPPQGLSGLAEVCRRVRIPVLAIGGITLENAGACLEAGAGGVAAIRLFQESDDFAAVVSQLRAKS